MPLALPRLIISAVGGDGGKTLLSLGLTCALRHRGFVVAPFKKGPDYIDAAWLSLAAGRPARNLDTFLMEEPALRAGFARGLDGADFALIEGNRGLYDGVDDSGTHSTAALARLLACPVALVLDTTKVTRTLAAIALGCKLLEPETPLAAVILNRVATARQEALVRRAIERDCGLPVVGAVKRRRGSLLPDRHLGLVTPAEHDRAVEAVEAAAELVGSSVDLDRLIEIARGAPELDQGDEISSTSTEQQVTVGVIRDAAFSFYYPENLEALERQGARLRPISSMDPNPLPDDLDGLYIGGGFPETHAAQIAANRRLLDSLRDAAEHGLPIYAECGGLMLLSRSFSWQGATYPMASVFPVDVEVKAKPAGHGYCVVRVDQANPFFDRGTQLRGHEFHYSTVIEQDGAATAYAVERGVGCFDKRDGLVYKNVLASYAHLHALGARQWSRGFVRRALRHHRTHNGKHWPDEADP